MPKAASPNSVKRYSRKGLTMAKANRRGELVCAAARLFREKGYAATTTRDIADAVGMQSGSAFYHFASKQELLAAVMEEGLTGGLARTSEVMARPLPIAEKFRAMVRTHLGILLEAGNDFIPVMLHDWGRLEPVYKQRLIATKDGYDAHWHDLIAELVRAGLLAGDAKTARLSILGALNFTATWFKVDGGVSIDTLARRMAGFFLRET